MLNFESVCEGDSAIRVQKYSSNKMVSKPNDLSLNVGSRPLSIITETKVVEKQPILKFIDNNLTFVK